LAAIGPTGGRWPLWAGVIATFLAASVALLVAAGVFDSLRGPWLRLTFDRAELWCRTGAQGELWVRVAVENAARARAPAHGCVGRLVALTTDGWARTDLDPVQLRWAGVPRSRVLDAIDIRPGQREFLRSRLSLGSHGRSGAPAHLGGVCR
jgi:hypothetical protein